MRFTRLKNTTCTIFCFLISFFAQSAYAGLLDADEIDLTCRWTSDFECRDKYPGNYADGKCVIKGFSFNEPECKFVKHQPGTQDNGQAIGLYCSRDSDNKCRNMQPGNYHFGKCIVTRTVLDRIDCQLVNNDDLQQITDLGICRWTSDFQCKDKYPGNYTFGRCVVNRIEFDEPVCKLVNY